MAHELRPYQCESLFELRSTIAKHIRAIVLQMATGSGKTTVASEIMKGAVAKGNRAYFIADSIELVDQAARRFHAEGLPVGVIQGDHEWTDYSKAVQVATIQTLQRRWPELPESHKPAVVVIDECHVLHQAHIQIIEECKTKAIPVIGLSATPFRKGLGKVFDHLVVGATTEFLTREGWLVPATCYGPHIPNLKGVKTSSNGDWQEDALAEVMGDAKLLGDVVDHWFRLAEDRQTLVFGCNVAHSRALCDAFQRAGVAAEHLDGYERDPERRADVIRRFKSGEIRVLCNVAILTKGFDAPECSALVIARPTKSLMMHYQIMGRTLRTAPGKRDAIIIDHAGNCTRLGTPTDAIPARLDDGRLEHHPDRRQKQDDEPVYKPCISCGFISKYHVCPQCGFAPKARQDVEVREGMLYEVKSGAHKEWSPADVQLLYAELLGYAQLKQRNPGWAWHKCREIAGRAPANTRQIEPIHPSEKTMGICKHLDIKFAKGMGAKRKREGAA